MFKDIKVTLYDIFGYLLPGAVFLAGIAMLFWTIIIPDVPLSLPHWSGEIWVLVLVVAYISGHMAQALGNYFFPRLLKNEQNKIPETILQTVKSQIGKSFSIDSEKINPDYLHRICEHVIVQSGYVEDREVYIYREGFYRGVAIASFLLGVSLIIRMIIPGFAVLVDAKMYQMKWGVAIFFVVVFLAFGVLSFLRYRRFVGHSANQAIVGSLVALKFKQNKVGGPK